MTHSVCLLLGSNIKPEENLFQAMMLLQREVTVIRSSSIWESEAVGSEGPNFLNAAVLVQSTCGKILLKEQVCRPLEAMLGRIRTKDRNAPRTIDIDIIIFDGQVVDPSLWVHAYVAVPVSEILVDYRSEEGQSLWDFAHKQKQRNSVLLRKDLSAYPFSTIFPTHNEKR